MIVEILIMSLSNKKWFLVVVEVKIRHISSSVFDNLVIGRACVGQWLVVYFWKLQASK
jgi:hypothetical protein